MFSQCQTFSLLALFTYYRRLKPFRKHLQHLQKYVYVIRLYTIVRVSNLSIHSGGVTIPPHLSSATESSQNYITYFGAEIVLVVTILLQ